MRTRHLLVAVIALAVAPGLVFGQTAPPAPVRVGGAIAAPVRTHHVAAEYPAQARAAGVQGVVIIEATIDGSGAVANARVLRSIPLLDEAALAAVRQWRYTPVLLNGAPVPIVMTVTVPFMLEGAPASPGVARGGFARGSASPGTPVTPVTSLPGSNPATRGGRGGQPSMTSTRPGFVDFYERDPARFSALPAWDPAISPEPPLSPGAALLAAQMWGQRQSEPLPQDVSEVSLTQVLGVWAYRVRLGRPRPGAPSGAPRMVIVLLDGSILEPTRSEPRPQ